jgi:hypothetical protein
MFNSKFYKCINAEGIESVVICITNTFDSSANPLILSCVYRSPSSSYQLLLNWFSNIKTHILYPYSKHLIIGDFNMPNIDWSIPCCTKTDIVHDLFLEQILSAGLTQCVHEPTRIHNTLDLIFTTVPDRICNVRTCAPFSNSDHTSVTFSLDTYGAPTDSSLTAENATYLDFTNADFRNISLAIRTTDWHTLFNEANNIQACWDIFTTKLYSLVKQYVPTRKCKQSKQNEKYPWTIRRLAALKHTAWSRYKRHHRSNDLQNYKH